MVHVPRLVVASNNPGKLREFAALLEPLGIESVAQGTLGIDEADEPFATFVENALAKARHASRHAGLPALADDSGLCVDALDGEPGVRSARYAATDAVVDRATQDARNNARLVSALHDVADRSGRYVCALVMVRSERDPEPIIAMGEWHGRIVDVPRGAYGFGYDPHFFIPAFGMTAAELDPAIKNRISHRALALRRLVEALGAREAPSINTARP